MKLTEWDHYAGDEGQYVEVEYPDQIVRKFVEWFRNTKQWRESGGMDMVWQKFRRLELELAEVRNGRNAQRAEGRCSATTAAGEPCKGRAAQDGLCPSHLRAARAA